MRAVIQRVSSATVRVGSEEISRIGRGFLVLLGVRKGDGKKDLDYLVRKVAGLRVFEDEAGKMNRSLDDPMVQGEILAVSQFTLLGDVRKGNRPSFIEAEEPERAERMFNAFVQALRERSIPVKSGVFRTHMDVSLVNDGPVTILVDSKRASPEGSPFSTAAP